MLERFTVGQGAASYSAAVVAEGRFAFISGHGPLTDGQVVPGTIEEETRLTLSNLLQTIEAVGGDRDSIVRCNCFLGDINDFRAFDGAYRALFGSSFPARTTIGADLYEGIKVEVEAVIVLPP